jgi:hypothetical protein
MILSLDDRTAARSLAFLSFLMGSTRLQFLIIGSCETTTAMGLQAQGSTHFQEAEVKSLGGVRGEQDRTSRPP